MSYDSDDDWKSGNDFSGEDGANDSLITVSAHDSMNDKEKLDKYYFYVQTISSGAFKQMVDHLNEVTTECLFKFVFEKGDAKPGIYIDTMSGDRNSFVRIFLDGDKFNIYQGECNMQVGINIEDLHKQLKVIENSDVLTMFVSKKRAELFSLRGENSSEGNETDTRIAVKIRPTEEVDRIPVTQDYTNYITIPSASFTQTCKGLSNNDDVGIRTKTGTIKFISKGINGESSKIHRDTTVIVDPEEKYVNHGIFPMKLICKFSKCKQLSKEVTFMAKENEPLVIRISVSNLGELYLLTRGNKYQENYMPGS